jgi:hypothetical protein
VVPQRVFESLTYLKSLDLGRSRIEIISKNSFGGLKSLEQLDMNLNSFTGIGHEKIEEFNGNYNMENTIPFDTFSDMINLHRLSIGFNRITFIGKSAFFGLDSLSQGSHIIF